ncbi:MAG: hypothetical protein AAFX58_02785 [Pseudomonadota bacterium]
MLFVANPVLAGDGPPPAAAPARETIEALFPAPPDGWQLGAVQISYGHGARRQIAAHGAVVDELRTRGVRVTARRRYVRDGRAVTIVIATNDIEGTVRIDAVDAAAGFSDELRDGLQRGGLRAIEHDGRPGIASDEDGERVHRFRAGVASTVTLRCEARDCGDMLERLPALLDWPAVETQLARIEAGMQETARGGQRESSRP